MAINLGTAYIEVLPSANKLAPAIRKEMALVEREQGKSGGRSGKGWAAGMLGTAGKILGGAAVAGIGLAAGTAITKGFSRAIDLQEAEAKLSGLGHSADGIAKIMDNALKAVKGTAFGLGDAATVAASIVAAGVKPGKELESTLTLVGDAATTAGVDMTSMGAIFGKVAASNRLTLGVVNQLSTAGIPALTAVADEMGITAEEASKMVSSGKVDFDTFSAAMESSLGGAAQASGNTFKGALANMGAALGRLGEGFAAPFVQNAPALFAKIGGAVDKLGPVLAPIAEDVAKRLVPAMQGLGDGIAAAVDKVPAFVQGLKDAAGWVKDNATWLAPLGVALGVVVAGFAAWSLATSVMTAAQAALNVVLALNPIGIIIIAVAALVAGLVYFFTQTKIGQKIIAGAWKVIKSVVGGVVTFLKIWFVAVATGFILMGKWMSFVWRATLKPIFDGLIKAGRAVWSWLTKYVFQPIGLYFKVMAIGMRNIFNTIIRPLWDGFSKVASKAWGVIKSASSSAWNWIKTYVFAPFRPAINAIGDAFKAVGKVIKSAWDGIKKAAASPVNFVIQQVYMKGIKGTWDKVAKAVGLDLKLPSISPIAFANGSEDHRAQIARPGAMRLWAEPETGGEAYIPLAGKKRGRSTQILGAVARKFGYGLTKYADGGIAGDVWDTGKRFLDFVTNPVKAFKDKIGSMVGAGGTVIGQVAKAIPGKIIAAIGKKISGAIGGGSTEGFTGSGKGGAIGAAAMTNIVRQLIPGAVITSGYRPGARVAGYGTLSYHARNRAIDIAGGPGMSAIWDRLNSVYGSASQELLYSPKGARQILSKGHRGNTSGVTRANHFSHVHWAMANGGLLYDKGGLLNHGGIGVNQTGKPEAVLTPRETKAYKAMAVRAASAASVQSTAPTQGTRVNMTVTNWREGTGYFEEVAEDVVHADSKFNRTRGRMG